MKTKLIALAILLFPAIAMCQEYQLSYVIIWSTSDIKSNILKLKDEDGNHDEKDNIFLNTDLAYWNTNYYILRVVPKTKAKYDRYKDKTSGMMIWKEACGKKRDAQCRESYDCIEIESPPIDFYINRGIPR